MRPVLANALLQFCPTVSDPELRRMELADLAVDVVAATRSRPQLLVKLQYVPILGLGAGQRGRLRSRSWLGRWRCPGPAEPATARCPQHRRAAGNTPARHPARRCRRPVANPLPICVLVLRCQTGAEYFAADRLPPSAHVEDYAIMADPRSGEPLLHDLVPVVDVAVSRLSNPSQIQSLIDLVGLVDVRYPGTSASARELWMAVFSAALEESPETLGKLLKSVRVALGKSSTGLLDDALRQVGHSCVSRITRVTSPHLGDQAGALLEAGDVPAMKKAAGDLRQTALDIRRLLMRPVLTDPFLQLAPSVLDPENRRMELADLAVDVVTAVDYLLSLLGAPGSLSPPFVLEAEAGSDRGHGATDSDALDRLNRRRLDARSSAVRLGMRLLAALRSDVANQL